MDFGKFIRIVTEGGTDSEINFIRDAMIEQYKKNLDYDFLEEHINFHKTNVFYDYVTRE